MSGVLVAAMGSTVRGDDGFGPVLLARVAAALPEVRCEDFGTHGVALIQRLHDGWDALVLLDACQHGGPVGRLHVVRPQVEPAALTRDPRSLDAVADVHLTDPARVLAIAAALGVLPRELWLVGCEIDTVDGISVGLSAPVEAALPGACDAVLALVRRLGAADGR